jgi:hypothetical protein
MGNGGARLKIKKEEKGLLNDKSGCQRHPMAFVKTPFFLCAKVTMPMMKPSAKDIASMTSFGGPKLYWHGASVPKPE